MVKKANPESGVQRYGEFADSAEVSLNFPHLGSKSWRPRELFDVAFMTYDNSFP
jgi:hypothetical protein